MKKITYLLLLCCFSVGYTYTQDIIKVSAIPGEGDYADLQVAIDAANPGSIVMLYPGTYSANYVFSKPLTFLGSGYNIMENFPSTQPAIGNTILAGTVTITSIAAGSRFIGLTVPGSVLLNNTSNIEVSNCHLGYIKITSSATISLNQCIISSAVDNIIESPCYGPYQNWASLFVEGANGNIEVKNCLFPFFGEWPSAPNRDALSTSNGVSGTISIENSIFRDQVCISAGGLSTVMKNNIFMHTVSASSTTAIFNNVCSGTCGSSGLNAHGVDMTTVFVGYPTQGTYSFDAKWQLKLGSPAIGYALNGGDCGIFGGSAPYKLSGLPDIPLIYELNVPNSGTSGGGINVNIKARSEN